jgi:hypothetical protein
VSPINKIHENHAKTSTLCKFVSGSRRYSCGWCGRILRSLVFVTRNFQKRHHLFCHHHLPSVSSAPLESLTRKQYASSSAAVLLSDYTLVLPLHFPGHCHCRLFLSIFLPLCSPSKLSPLLNACQYWTIKLSDARNLRPVKVKLSLCLTN